MNDWPRILEERIVDAFGPYSLVEQSVEVSAGSFETWRIVSRPETVKVIAEDSAGRILLVQRPKEDSARMGWQLPTAEIICQNPVLAAQEVLDHFGLAVLECYVLGRSPDAATIRHPIVFIVAKVRGILCSGEEAQFLLAEDVLEILRSREIRDDRSAKYLYDYLPLVLVSGDHWRFQSPRHGYSGLSPVRKSDVVLSRKKFGMFTLLEIENRSNAGDDSRRHIIQRPDGVRIGAFNEEGRLLLTHERRSEIGGWDMRLPGGKVKDGETALAARKELAEETGFLAKNWELIYQSIDEINTHYVLHFFLARDLIAGQQALHGAEDIQVTWHSQDSLFSLLRSKTIGEDRTARILYDLLHVRLDDR